MEFIGYLGGILLSLCALPEMMRTIRDKKCDLGYGMLCMWLIGEVLVLIYIFPKGDLPLLLNYSLNTAIITTMLYYKIKEKK